MKMRKRNQVAINSALSAKISYRRCFEEDGIIQTQDGRYTRMFRVSRIGTEETAGFDVKTAQQKMAAILDALPMDVRFQFVIHNRHVDADESRMRFLIDPEEKEDALRPYVEAFDRIVLGNAEIGHNNTEKSVYYILSVAAETVDDAARRFKKLLPILEERFHDLYGIWIFGMTLMERLEVMHSMYNLYGRDFGKEIDLGNGSPSLENLRYMHMTTKDIIAPASWNTSRKLIDHSILDEKGKQPVYVRALYIGSVPEKVSASFIADMTSISAQMVFSMIYEPVDSKIGFQEVSGAVATNTEVRMKSRRETISERRNRSFQEIHEEKTLDEDVYFHKAALRVFKDARAGEHRTFFCTFTVMLYGESLEALDKDTELLYLSAAKFSASVNTLDLQQCEGFQTCLPLCYSRVSCARLFDTRRLSVMSPVGIQDAIRRNGLYCGINAVNDNLVLLNRKNNTNLSGLIAGTDHPGCTTQVKREAFNALIGTEDVVHIITGTDEYDAYADRLGGVVRDFSLPDIFTIEVGYGLLEDDHSAKSLFLEALFEEPAGTQHQEIQGSVEENSELEQECVRLVSALRDKGIRDGERAIRYLEQEQEAHPRIAEKLIELFAEYGEMREMPKEAARLIIHRAANLKEKLILMDMLWNQALSDKHDGISHWIFIDPADELLTEAAAAEYLLKYMQNASLFQTVATISIGNTVRILGKPATAVALENLVQTMGYVKLLNQGPVERKRYAELLDIPNALLPYISNVEPGKGIILTPSGNVAFNDNFTELCPEGSFKDLFIKEVEQIRFDRK